MAVFRVEKNSGYTVMSNHGLLEDCDYKGELPDGMVALMIPNAEIKEIFETTVIKWFDDSTKKWNRNVLFDAVWKGDGDGITREMNALLRRTISYHDYREDFYHAFLAGIFTGAGYMVDSNKEHGESRSDHPCEQQQTSFCIFQGSVSPHQLLSNVLIRVIYLVAIQQIQMLFIQF